MKKLMIISTLSLLSLSVFAQDSCSMLSGQEQRLNSCSAEITKTQNDIRNLEAGINQTQQSLSPRAQSKRIADLKSCNNTNAYKDQQISVIQVTNKEAIAAITRVSSYKQDIASRVSGNKLIESFECVTIDHRAGNSRVDNDWGAFAGGQAIFIGEGKTQAMAQQSMIQDAARKHYFTKNASSRKKRILENMQCLPVYAVDKAERELDAVNGIITDANKIKFPTIATSRANRRN